MLPNVIRSRATRETVVRRDEHSTRQNLRGADAVEYRTTAAVVVALM